MTAKPKHISGYANQDQVARVRSTCLYMATILGDVLDELVIVGGLVPSLIIPQADRDSSDPFGRHVGTLDLDLGMQIALLETTRYEALLERIKAAGFKPELNENGKPKRWCWQIDIAGKVTVDFLIPPSKEGEKGLRQIQPDFAAVIAPGLDLAFANMVPITIDDFTIKGERAKRVIPVCGAGAYVLLKAIAMRGRGEHKDAYDLFYVLRNYGSGVDEVVTHAKPLLGDKQAQNALVYLQEDFAELDHVGPRRVAEFITGGLNEDIQADVRGVVVQFVEACRR